MKLVVSPMAGVTDAPFRKLAISHGADYAISEMITSQTALWVTPKTQQRLKLNQNEPFNVIQIAGASPDIIVDAATTCLKLKKPDAFEINMGCPAKKVCNVLAGSALLRNPQLVNEILLAIVKAVKIPVFLKTRLGWDHGNENILDIAIMAQDIGIKSLAIHGRTRMDMYNGEARYDLIAKVKKMLSIPVFANGDINSPEKALAVLELTNANGLYIGRGALGKPWLFQQIKDYIANGKYDNLPDKNYLIDLMLEHIRNIHEHYGNITGIKFARKHFKWYLQANPSIFTDQHQSLFSKFSILENCDNQLEYVDSLKIVDRFTTFFI